jgi:hypothetical protein
MVHVIQLAVDAFMRNLGVKCPTKSLVAHECDQQYGENERLDIATGQTLRKEGNARINKVAAKRPGLAKMIENVCISRHFEPPETKLHIAENADCIDYTHTGLSK